MFVCCVKIFAKFWKYQIKHVSLRPLFDDESIITTNQMFCHLHTHFAFIRHILVVIIGDNPEFTSAVAEAFYIGQHPGQFQNFLAEPERIPRRSKDIFCLTPNYFFNRVRETSCA